jgi:hypothetical protein
MRTGSLHDIENEARKGWRNQTGVKNMLSITRTAVSALATGFILTPVAVVIGVTTTENFNSDNNEGQLAQRLFPHLRNFVQRELLYREVNQYNTQPPGR